MIKALQMMGAFMVGFIALPVFLNLDIPSTLFALWAPMQINTAVALACLALALLFLAVDNFKWARPLALLAFVIGAATVFQYLSGINIGIDQILRAAHKSILIQYPGRMAMNTALSLASLGLSIFVLARPRPKNGVLFTSAALGLLPLGLGLLKIISYCFGISGSMDPASYLHMALPTAIGVCVAASLVMSKVILYLVRSEEGDLWFKPLGLTSFFLLITLAFWQILLNQEMLQLNNLIAARSDAALAVAIQRLDNSSMAMQRFANRLEYLGVDNKEYIAIDAHAYLQHIPIFKRIGLIGADFKVYWSYPLEIQKQVKAFDQSVDPLRRQAVEDASRKNGASMSHVVALRSGGAGFLMPVPIRRQHKAINYIYATIEANKLFHGLIDAKDFQIAIEENGQALVFERSYDAPSIDLTHEANLEWGLAKFHVALTPSMHFVRHNRSPLPHFVLLIGSFLSLLLGFFQFTVARARKSERLLIISKEIQRSEAKFRGIFESTMFGLIFWNKQGEIFDANDEFLKLVGYSREDLAAGLIDWQKMTPEEYLPAALQSLEEFKTMGKCVPYEKEYFHKDGSRIAVLVGGTNLPEVSGIGGVGFILDNSARKRTEKALESSEIKFSVVTESIPQIVWSADAFGKYDFFNQRWTDYTGLTLVQSVGMVWDKLVHPDDLNLFNERWNYSLSQGEAYEVEYRLKGAADGRYRWYLRRATPLRDGQGKIIKWFGTCTDIHDQKIAYAELVESKKQVDSIIANTDAIIFSVNKLGIMTHSDGKGLRALGFSPGERVGKSVFELHKDNPDVLDIDRRALSGEKISVRTQFNGIWMEVHYDPVFDAQGLPDGATGVVLNIHAKVLAEQALHETQKKLKAVLEHVPFAFWAIDQSRKFIFREGIGMKVVGLSSDQMVGRSIDEVYKDFPHVLTAMNRAFAGETFEAQTEIGGRWYNIAFAPTRNESTEVIGISGITFDITDRKRLEDDKNILEVRENAASMASKLKSDFLANMSHEIRTPLNAILGMSDLILETHLDKEQQALAKTVSSSGKHLLTLINDILDFSKIEAGKLELEIIDFNLISLIEAQADLLVTRAREKSLSLMTYVDPTLPLSLRGDPGRIGQILLNFIGNAIKFTSQGNVIVRALAAVTPSAHANAVNVRFVVEDRGIGISPEARDRLFQPFNQADNSTARKFGGTGLGLSISKNLVELMNGKIGVESSVGQGSLFWFEIELPLGAANAGAPKRFVKSTEAGARPTVLVVDDDLAASHVMTTYIKNWGINVVVADSGRQALEKLESAVAEKLPFDLVLIDRQMPEMDGFSLAEKIKSNPALAKIPMILVSAFERRGQDEEALQRGFTACLKKPLKQSDLYNSIMQGLNRFDLNADLASLTSAANSAKPNQVEKRKERILVAEDVTANQMLIVRYLEILGYSSQVVADGQAVLDAIGSNHFDLILMDCQMPVMDGFEATQKIRQLEKQTGNRITIIALTANAMKEDEKKCLDAGMDGFLSKPLGREKLDKLLSRCFAANSSDARVRKAS